MCIGSNSVNQAQDLISVTKFEDFPNSLLPIRYIINLNDDKIRNTAWYSQPEAISWGRFRLAAPSCSGFLARIDLDRFQNWHSRSGD